MDDCRQFVAELLAGDRPWLTRQPGLASWPDCCRRLGDAMCGWIEQISSSWSGTPLRCADQPHWPSGAELPPVKDAGGKGDLPACLRRLWQVWRHHWQDAQKQAGGPVDGFEVAAAVQSGHGFSKYRQRSTEERTAAGRQGKSMVQELADAHLKGDPFHDAVLVELAAAGDAEAIDYLRKHFRHVARQIAGTRKRRYDPADWDSFVNIFASDGRLARYGGQSGLSTYLSTAYARDCSDPKLGRQAVQTELRRLSYRKQWIALDQVLTADRRLQLAEYLQTVARDQAAKVDARWRVRQVSGQLTSQEQVAWQQRLEESRQQQQRTLATDELDEPAAEDVADCTELLIQLLGDAVQTLDSRERFVLDERYRAGTLAKVVAALLNLSGGQLSRIEKRAVARLIEFVQQRIQQDDTFAECCRECWELLAERDGMGRLSERLGQALEEFAKDYQRPAATDSADDHQHLARPNDSTGKRGAKSAPNRKGDA